MTTYRAHHNHGDFFTMAKEVVNDEGLSFRAKWILAYIISHADNWQVQLTDLVKHGSEGYGAIRTALNELESAGYIVRKREAMTPYFEADGVTLYCRDAREFLRTLEDNSVDFVFTDPPYGHNNNSNGDLIHRREAALGISEVQEARTIENDGTEANELFEYCAREYNRILKPGSCCCCCGGGGGPDPQFARWSLVLDDAMEFKQMVVWDKGPMGMGWHYRRSYETILVAMKKGAACKWYDDTSKVENVVRPGDYGIRKIIPSKEQHPTEKPVELPYHFIGLHAQRGDLVIDPFMGGGSTAIAALIRGCKFIGVEIDERWCEYSARRIERELMQPRLFTQDDAPSDEHEQQTLW